MSGMVRVGDMVREEDELVALKVEGIGEDGRLLVRTGTHTTRSLPDNSWTLLCACPRIFEDCNCTGVAVTFTADGTPLCEGCSASVDGPLLDVRPDRTALVLCACGESLDGRPGRVWTMGDIACEYRDCANCGSTRAYMPADIVRGRHIGLYENPETSEVSGEWDSLLDALEHAPAKELAELRRNGRLLARAFVGPGVCGWLIATPEKED